MFEFLELFLATSITDRVTFDKLATCESENSGIGRRLLEDDFTLQTVITRKLWTRKTTFF